MSFLISEMIRECKLQTNYALYSKNVCNLLSRVFYIRVGHDCVRFAEVSIMTACILLLCRPRSAGFFQLSSM